MFKFLCELLNRAIDAWKKLKTRPKDFIMIFFSYLETFGSAEEKVAYQELTIWLDALLRKRYSAKFIMCNG